MVTYWNLDVAGGLPPFLGNTYPESFIKEYGDESVVKIEIHNLSLLLYTYPGENGVPYAATPMSFDIPLRQQVKDIVENNVRDIW